MFTYVLHKEKKRCEMHKEKERFDVFTYVLQKEKERCDVFTCVLHKEKERWDVWENVVLTSPVMSPLTNKTTSAGRNLHNTEGDPAGSNSSLSLHLQYSQ